MKERPILFSGPMVRAILDGRKTMTRRVINMDRLYVTVPRLVRADVPGYGYAEQGRHKATMNKLGAVSCFLPNGKQLGLKPGEFKFSCPFADGETFITDGKWDILGNGSRLWVKETWKPHADVDENGCITDEHPIGTCIKYRADGAMIKPTSWNEEQGFFCEANENTTKWRPSIFMPRWASRITLEVTGVRVERLQEITEDDCQAEGVEHNGLVGYYCDEDFNDEFGGQHRCNWRAGFAHLWDQINEKRGFGWKVNPWVWVVIFKRI